MRIFEKVAFLFALAGVILKFYFIASGNLFTVIGLMSLCWLYFYLSFALLNGIRLRTVFKKATYSGIPKWHIIGAIMCGGALGFGCLGILFKLESWPNPDINLLLGLVSGLVVTVISLMKLAGKHKIFYNRVLSRVVATTLLCLLFMMLPNGFFLKVFHRNNPAFIEALEQSEKDPTNQKLKDKVHEELNKSHGY